MADRIVRSPFITNSIDIPDESFAQTIWTALQTNTSKIALREVETGESVTYGQLLLRAELVARRLLHHGCRRGDVIAIFLPNSITWVVACIASWRIGLVPAAFDFLLTVGELEHQLRACGAKHIFSASASASVALKAAESVNIRTVFANGSTHLDSHVVDIQSAPRDIEQLPPLPSFEHLSIAPRDPAVIFFSSGTTGLQKGVLLCHRNIQFVSVLTRHPEIQVIRPFQLVFAPFSHVAGGLTVLCALASGFTSLVLLRFDLNNFLRTLDENKIEGVLLVPSVATMMVKNAKSSQYKLRHLKDVIMVSAPASADLENQLIAAYPGLNLRQAYGQTEACAMETCVRLRPHGQQMRLPGSVGAPLPFIQMKVIDITTGESLGPNATGELCVQSPMIMLGYINNPQATAEAVDSDGWLHTGDIGYYDDNGNFFISDRLKELIKYNSYQVVPAEIEGILLSHPEVADAGVVGLPDPEAGELPLAWVVKKPNTTVTEGELQQFVSGKVAPYMKLRGGIHFVMAIPRTATGKIVRREIRAAISKSKL